MVKRVEKKNIPMRFSLVLATKGRTTEVKYFLRSLQDQKEGLEVIIIDQNDDDRLQQIIKPFQKSLKIVHLTSKPGLSRSRNLGIREASGDIIAFPDDDCEYLPDTLTNVASFFESHPGASGVSGRTVDRSGANSAGKFGDREEEITRSNIWRSHNSVGLFLKIEVTAKVGDFDEQMGLGSYFSSSEETDYVIRSLKLGFKLYYDPSIKIYHPRVDILSQDKLAQRGLNYGRGVGRLLKKHPDFFAPRDFLKVFLGPIIRGIFSFRLRQLIFDLNLERGRIEGYLKS